MSDTKDAELVALREAIYAAGFGILTAGGKITLHCTTDAAKKAEQVETRLIVENERLNRLAPLCAEHGAGNGTRSGCPYCAITTLYAVLSKIDYLTGEPNEMQCSGFDVSCDEGSVIENVKRLRVERDAAREDARKSAHQLSVSMQSISNALNRVTQAEAERDALRGRADELAAALKPFANWKSAYYGGNLPTWGDVCRAATALARYESASAPKESPVEDVVLASGVTEKGRMFYEMYEKRFGKPDGTPSNGESP